MSRVADSGPGPIFLQILRKVHLLMLQLILGFAFVSHPLAAGGPSSPPAGVLTISNFSRDRTLFDSGAQIGLNRAAVPLTGTGTFPAGTALEMRAVSTDDGGATSTPWQSAGNMPSGGHWTAMLSAPRSSSWYRAEVRVVGVPASVVQTPNRFGVGHVWAIYEQSNMARAFDPGFNLTTPKPVLDPQAVQLFAVNRTVHSTSRVLISDTTPNSAATVAFANAFIASRPGEKLAIAAHVLSGTSPMEMTSDGLTTRLWSDEALLHNAITADGAKVGLVTSAGWISWAANPYNLNVMYPVITGKTAAGAIVPMHSVVVWDPVSPGSFTIDHNMTEFYDWSYSRYAICGAHGRAMVADQTGYADTFDANYEDYQTAWQAIPANPNFSHFLPYSFEQVDAARGIDDGAGGWMDEPHHSALNPDGLERHAAVYTLAILKSAGLVNWSKPNFTNAYWEPSGAYVDYWIAGHNITTERKRRGLAAIPATYPHRTEVMGWTINGVPATNAVIVANAGGSGWSGVRITPTSGVFTYASKVDYGRGRSVGFQKYPQDYQDSYWLNLPVVDMGQAGVVNLPVKPLSTVGIANTLSAPAQFTTTTGYFQDPAALGAGVTSLRIEWNGSFAYTGQIRNLMSLNGRPSLKVLQNGQLQMDWASTTDLAQKSVTLLTAGQVYKIVMIYDLTAKTAKLEINGVPDVTHPLANTAASFASTYLVLLAALAGGSPVPGTWSSIKVWKNDPTGAGTPYKTIAGNAAAVNADPWKRGAAAN